MCLPCWLAYTRAVSLKQHTKYTERAFAAYLSAVAVNDRLRRATELFVKQASISEVTKKIAQSIDETLSKQQKEFFLRQQLAAIQRELQALTRSSNQDAPGGIRSSGISELDDPEQAEAEDMADIKHKIEAMAKDSEERKMAVREWKRFQRIPSGSVEHGVIRNYVRLMLVALRIPSLIPLTSLNGLHPFRGHPHRRMLRPPPRTSCAIARSSRTPESSWTKTITGSRRSRSG